MRNILVLSGGGSHGCFEIGIVSRLIQDGKGSWDLITGVSAGSINACYLSTIEKEDEKNHIGEFKKLWTDFKNADVYSNEFFLNGLSIFNNELFRKKLETIFGDKKPIRPVMIGTTSLSTSESKIFENDDMIKYGFKELIMCSTAIPILFPPNPFLNDVFVDGGLTSNILLYDAINYCLKKFLGEKVHVDIVICGRKIPKDNINKDNLNFVKLLDKLKGIITQQVEYSEIVKNIDFESNISITVYEEKEEISIGLLNFEKGKELWEQGFSFSNVNKYNIEI